jgi:hypothetical protein
LLCRDAFRGAFYPAPDLRDDAPQGSGLASTEKAQISIVYPAKVEAARIADALRKLLATRSALAIATLAGFAPDTVCESGDGETPLTVAQLSNLVKQCESEEGLDPRTSCAG